ncbi:MAG: precorrin-8X methylmutase [Clostridia bacterium]|nr:precorrin-8X methylmutase [Clostridia bacterium]
MDFIRDPKAIEIKSMELIEELLGEHSFSQEEKTIAKRMIHAAGDPELGSLIRFHPQAVDQGIMALKQGAPIFTDVKMAAVGINSRVAGYFGSTVNCVIGEPFIAEEAKEAGITRAMAAFRHWGPRLDGSIVAIGNAPTALFELLRLHEEEGITPALVVGVPVGFVGAAESKEALVDSPLLYITVKGRKGGSPLAASAVNALLYMCHPDR